MTTRTRILTAAIILGLIGVGAVLASVPASGSAGASGAGATLFDRASMLGRDQIVLAAEAWRLLDLGERALALTAVLGAVLLLAGVPSEDRAARVGLLARRGVAVETIARRTGLPRDAVRCLAGAAAAARARKGGRNLPLSGRFFPSRGEREETAIRGTRIDVTA